VYTCKWEGLIQIFQFIKTQVRTRNKGLRIIHGLTYTRNTTRLHFDEFLGHIFHDGTQEGVAIGIPDGAVGTNLPLISGEHTELTHLQHREHKLLKEESLVDGKAGDNVSGPLIGVEVLVGGEQALSVHEVNVVPVVEDVGGSNVQHCGVVGGVGGASESEIFAKGFVHDRVLWRVESVGERAAVADAYGVATGEGYHIGGVEVFGGEGV